MRAEGLGANIYLTGAFCGCATKSLKKFSSDASAGSGSTTPAQGSAISDRVHA